MRQPTRQTRSIAAREEFVGLCLIDSITCEVFVAVIKDTSYKNELED